MIGAGVIDEIGLENGVAGLEEIGVGWGELHAIGDELEDELVAGGEAVFGDEIGAGIPESDAPDFA